MAQRPKEKGPAVARGASSGPSAAARSADGEREEQVDTRGRRRRRINHRRRRVDIGGRRRDIDRAPVMLAPLLASVPLALEALAVIAVVVIGARRQRQCAGDRTRITSARTSLPIAGRNAFILVIALCMVLLLLLRRLGGCAAPMALPVEGRIGI